MGWYKFEIPFGQAMHGNVFNDFMRAFNPEINTGIVTGLFDVRKMALFSKRHSQGTTYYVSPELAKLDAIIERWHAELCEMPDKEQGLSLVIGSDPWDFRSHN